MKHDAVVAVYDCSVGGFQNDSSAEAQNKA